MLLMPESLRLLAEGQRLIASSAGREVCGEGRGRFSLRSLGRISSSCVVIVELRARQTGTYNVTTFYQCLSQYMLLGYLLSPRYQLTRVKCMCTQVFSRVLYG